MHPEVGFSPEGIVLSLHLFSAPGHRSEETEKTKKEKFILRLALIIYSISHLIYQKITHRTSAKTPRVIQVIYMTVLPGAFSLPHFPFFSSYNCCTVLWIMHWKSSLLWRDLSLHGSFCFMESPCIYFLNISKPFWAYKTNNRMTRTGGSLFCYRLATWALFSDLSSRNKVLHPKPSSPVQVREKICSILQAEVSCKSLRRSYTQTGFISL